MSERHIQPADRLRDAEGPERTWAYGHVGSVLLSKDFVIALPAAICAGLIVALSKSAADLATPLLLAVAAILATLAGIVVAAHTIMIGLLTPEYMLILERAKGGIRGVSRPYRIVVWVCAVGAVVALLAALAWPLLPETSFWVWRVARGALFGCSVGAGAYALVGSAQLAGLATYHFEQRAQLQKVLRDARQRDNPRRSA